MLTHGINPEQLSCSYNSNTGQQTVDDTGIHITGISSKIDCSGIPQPPPPTAVPTVKGQPTPTAAPTQTPLPAGNNTLPGSNVQLSSSNTFQSPQTGETVTVGGSIQFSGITSPGVTTATLVDGTGTDVPANFAVGINGLPGVYMDVSTTAAFTPPITVCLAYPDANNDGFIDGTNPPLPETIVRILHRENGVFVDRTDPSKTNYAANIVCATTASLSPFVQAAEINVPGGGSAKTDCVTEFQLRRNSLAFGDTVGAAPYIPFKQGIPNAGKISCRDGDSCDADTVAGQCTFTVIVCPNETDSRLAKCAPTDVAKYVLSKPLPTAKDPTDASTASDLLTKLAALGASTVSGKTVTYSPSLATSACSDPISVVVPLKSTKGGLKKANKTIKLTAYTAANAKDNNSLVLTCNP
ncbi:MAG TPA: hypothetical protein VMW56_26590 [Candidatus Margulisiibacteriota bacterium]|nr:hypothetical protein [Candidatus Margulisiibacteriota bacterium]